MKDNFDIYKWKRDLIIRENKLFESHTEEEIMSQLKQNIEQNIPQYKNHLQINLPSKLNSNAKGKIKFTLEQDLAAEDVYFVASLLEKNGFEYLENESSLYFDYDEDRKFYPVITFTYL